MSWKVYDWKRDPAHWAVGVRDRESAFALAGCRAMASDTPQRVWDPETGEHWSVRFSLWSGGTRRLKDKRP